jgi:phage tail sheath protein FI
MVLTGFSHGIFTQYRDTVPRPVTQVLSNAIALVGSAPTYLLQAADRTINVPVRVLGDTDDARFAGPLRPGFTIPYALDAFRDNGAGTVDFVNVFNPLTHNTTATGISYTFTSNVIQLQRVIGANKTTDIADGLTGTFSVTGYVLGDDYTIDMTNGRLTRVVTGDIPAGATVSVTYTYSDPAKVTPANIIGAVVDGERTGMQAIRDLYNLRGYKPKMLVIPIYNEDGGVAAEMEALSDSMEIYFFLDAPAGTSRDEAIAGRSGTAPVGTFATASRRAVLCYPRVKHSDGSLQPRSQYIAGVTAGNDARNGYWFSPSNNEIKGIIGEELRLSGDYTDNNTDINALNAAGIVTGFAGGFGTGVSRVWGNRSALFPSDSSPLNFISVGRTIDIVMESIQRSSLPYLDRPINSALIDTILEGANAYIREQIQQGALIQGSEATYDVLQNVPSTLAAGRVIIGVRLAVPTPLETLIYESSLDISLLSSILPTPEVAV